MFSISITPRYQETDQMGVIHHSVYPIYYEQARVAFCDAIGLPFHEIEARNLRHAMIELQVKYHRPAVFGETYTIELRILEAGKLKLKFGYRLIDRNNLLINTGETLLVWLDEKLRPINLAKVHPDLYTLIKQYEI